jgi:hypothetical protein
MTAPLSGLWVAVDVQHLYRPSHAGDHGSIFTLPDGTHVTETSLSVVYAAALALWMGERGATLLVNAERTATLVGDYWTRNRQASAWGCHAYLACHVNAGGGRYAECAYMAGGTGAALSAAILASVKARHPEISATRAVPLRHGERGAVCVERVYPGAGVLLEPFFGDTAAHHALMPAPRLRALAESVGLGVVAWWHATRPAAP